MLCRIVDKREIVMVVLVMGRELGRGCQGPASLHCYSVLRIPEVHMLHCYLTSYSLQNYYMKFFCLCYSRNARNSLMTLNPVPSNFPCLFLTVYAVNGSYPPPPHSMDSTYIL